MSNLNLIAMVIVINTIQQNNLEPSSKESFIVSVSPSPEARPLQCSFERVQDVSDFVMRVADPTDNYKYFRDLYSATFSPRPLQPTTASDE